jgi:lipid-A-disaccharide synthase
MRIMISCGEASGDLYAAALARELRRRAPEAAIFGFGGPRLQAAGGELLGDFSGLSVTGLTEALRVVPRSLAMLRHLVREAAARRPDVFVAIDFPDFNFRLMASLRRLGVPVVYYISPQLWAWRPGRMKTMRAAVDRVLVIFPFEEAVYREAGVDARFVGHPLVDMAVPTEPRDVFLGHHGLDPSKPTVALLPGSRRNELERIVPVLAAALPLIRQRVPGVQYVVARAPNLDDALFTPLVGASGAGGRPVLVEGRADDVIASADVAVTASGTATVQCALHGRPMVVVYRLSPLTYRLGKPFVKVQMYAMPNLVAGRRLVPELIQDGFTPDRVAAETVALLTDSARRTQMQAGLREVRERLGGPGASGRAADAILEIACGAKSASS